MEILSFAAMQMNLEEFLSFCLSVCLSVCLGPHLLYMEVPRLGVKSELQLPAYTTATGIEPSISWFLVGFVSAAPQRELRKSLVIG